MIRTLQCRGRTVELGKKTLIMGILNVTPDSFSDGGKYNSVHKAVARAKEMVAEGADLIDIGGESTRPGFAPVSLEEELARVLPVVRAVSEAVDVPISIDTYKPETARQALQAGAHLINDIWGCRRDPGMAAVAAEFGCPIVLMHNRTHRDYTDLLPDIVRDLQESVKIAKAAGVPDEHIILDPGIGFAKDYEENLRVMNRLEEIVALDYPVLLGTSRKSMISKTLNLPADQVLEGTIATVVFGIAKGCRIVRVHDVAPVKKAVQMADRLMMPDAFLPPEERNAAP